MAVCTNCGANSTSGQFCVNCGKPVAAPAATFAAAPGADLPEHVACLLCYSLWALTGVVFLMLEPYNKSKLVRFHAWQSIGATGALFAGWILVLAVASILRFLPWIGVPLALLLFDLFGLVMVCLWLVLMFKAYQGGSLDLPFISRFAQKQA
jgi:uncharacterized membrane protein